MSAFLVGAADGAAAPVQRRRLLLVDPPVQDVGTLQRHAAGTAELVPVEDAVEGRHELRYDVVAPQQHPVERAGALNQALTARRRNYQLYHFVDHRVLASGIATHRMSTSLNYSHHCHSTVRSNALNTYTT